MTPITGGAVLAAGCELGDLQPAAGVCICVSVCLWKGGGLWREERVGGLSINRSIYRTIYLSYIDRSIDRSACLPTYLPTYLSFNIYE